MTDRFRGVVFTIAIALGTSTANVAHAEKIFFDSGGAIWRAEPDGSNAEKLTLGSPQEYNAVVAVSPDGQTIAYGHYPKIGPSDDSGIWLMSPDGTNKRKYPYESVDTFTPDGRRLVFLLYNGTEYLGLHTADLDGNDLRPIAIRPTGLRKRLWHARFLSDGRMLAIDPRSSHTRVYIVGLDGKAKKLSRKFRVFVPYCEGSPDGSKIVFVDCVPTAPGYCAPRLYVMDLASKATYELTGGEGHPVAPSLPSWSADGQTIMFSAYSSPAAIHHGAYAIDPDGFNERLVVANAWTVHQRPYSNDPSALLIQHAPILKYHSDEKFLAVSAAAATDYAENAIQQCSPYDTCPSPEPSCSNMDGAYSLDRLGELAYASGDGGMAERIDLASDFGPYYEAQADAFQSHPLYKDRIYGRALDLRPGGGVWLQYWLFYYYNPGFAGFDDHEGDWEGVQFHLPDDVTLGPTAAVFFQHGGGTMCGWNEVQQENGHPVVYVAHNSHASYPRAGDYSRPILPGGIDNEDVDGAGPVVTPEVEIVADTFPSWIDWGGRWGSSVGEDIPGGPCVGASPRGPKFQGDKWSNPVAWISSQANKCAEESCLWFHCNAGDSGVKE